MYIKLLLSIFLYFCYLSSFYSYSTYLLAEEEPITEESNNENIDSEEKLRTILQNYSSLNNQNISIMELNQVIEGPDNYVILYINNNPVVIQLYPDKAPNTVARFKELVRENFYDNTTIFRAIPNYFIQGGDPSNSGYGGSGVFRKEEISDLKFGFGSIAMSNTGEEVSDDSQFFITFNNFDWLDDKYTIFGQVISGMSHLESIRGTYSNDGFLTTPVIINRMVVLADIRKLQAEALQYETIIQEKMQSLEEQSKAQPKPIIEAVIEQENIDIITDGEETDPILNLDLTPQEDELLEPVDTDLPTNVINPIELEESGELGELEEPIDETNLDIFNPETEVTPQQEEQTAPTEEQPQEETESQVQEETENQVQDQQNPINTLSLTGN